MFYFLFCCCGNSLRTSSLGGWSFVLAYSSRLQSSTGRMPRHQRLETASHTALTVKSRGRWVHTCHWLACSQLEFSTLIQFRRPLLGSGATHGGTSLSALIKWRQALRDIFLGQTDVDSPSLRLPFQVILGCVKFTIKAEHRRWIT